MLTKLLSGQVLFSSKNTKCHRSWQLSRGDLWSKIIRRWNKNWNHTATSFEKKNHFFSTTSFHLCLKMCSTIRKKTLTCYHKRWKCKLRDNTDLTSFVNLSASKSGSNDNSAMSIGSENHDLIGIALLGKHRYAFGELSMIKICENKKKTNFDKMNSIDVCHPCQRPYII